MNYDLVLRWTLFLQVAALFVWVLGRAMSRDADLVLSIGLIVLLWKALRAI